MNNGGKVYNDGLSGKWLGFLIFIAIATIVAIYIANSVYYSDDPIVKKHVEYHSDSISVKTLAEVPAGAFIHRFIDFDLKKICYLNGAGGGIWCESLDTVLAGKDPKLIEDIISEIGPLYSSRNVTKWKHDNMEYYPEDYKPEKNAYRYYNKSKKSLYQTTD